MYERIYVQRCCIDNLDCEWQWQIPFILFAPVHYCLYHILLKPEFLLQRQGNKYSEQRSLTPHFSLTERLARFLTYNKFYPEKEKNSILSERDREL